MTALKAEIYNLVEEVPEEKLEKFLLVVKNFLKSEDNFYSAENQKHLRESIREFDEGKVVSFSEEEWEKI